MKKRVLITIPQYGGILNNITESLEKLGYHVDWKSIVSYTESNTVEKPVNSEVSYDRIEQYQ